jgi:hypothetical protein
VTAKRIAILGAGWAGIGCLQVLRAQGHVVHVYEQNDDVGGTWHPKNCYAGLKLHAAAAQIQYPGYPLPSNVDPMMRITAAQVHDYLRGYCGHMGFYEHMHFRHEVRGVSYDALSGQTALRFVGPDGVEGRSDSYDFVVHTNGFASRFVPHFEGRQAFKGEILHALEVTEERVRQLIRDNKRVVVVGGSKAATDFILNFVHYGYRVSWLFRSPYWFFRFDNTRPRSRLTSYCRGAAMLASYLLAARFPRISVAMLRRLGILDTYGKPHSDYRKFHLGNHDDAQLGVLREYARRNGIEGDISGFEPHAVLLSGASVPRVPADVVVCCTGSQLPAETLGVEANGTALALDEIHAVYRKRVIPAVPSLIFTGYHSFSLGVANGLTQGNWVARYVELAPSRTYLEKRAVTYPYAFFRQSFFSSDSYQLQRSVAVLAELVHAGELSLADVVRWQLRHLSDPSTPLTFRPFQKEVSA